MLGRLGLSIGYETAKSNFYAKMSMIKEFEGELAVYVNGVYIPENMASNWWAYGFGYTTRLSDKNSLYIDLERTSGGVFKQTLAVKVGYRIEF